MLEIEEIMMLDEKLKSKEEQIKYQNMLKENTIRYSDDSESIKKIVIKKIDDVIYKLSKMSESEYKNIRYVVSFDFDEDPLLEGGYVR